MEKIVSSSNDNFWFRSYLRLFKTVGLSLNYRNCENEIAGYVAIKDMKIFSILLALIGIKFNYVLGVAFILFAISYGAQKFKKIFEEEYKVSFSLEIFKEFIKIKDTNVNIREIMSLKNDEINSRKKAISVDVEDTFMQNPNKDFVSIRHAMLFIESSPLALLFKSYIFFVLFGILCGYSLHNFDNERIISIEYFFLLLSGAVLLFFSVYYFYFNRKMIPCRKILSSYENSRKLMSFYDEALYAGYSESQASKYAFTKLSQI